MQRRRWARRGGTALLLGSLALILSGCSVHDAEKKLRFGWPTGVTKQGQQMRVLWTWAGVTALAVGVFMWGLIFWCVIAYRKRNDELPRQTKFNLPVELVYSLAPFIIIAGLFYRTVIVEDNVNKLSKNPEVLIQVDAFKWNWQFEYLQDHGQPTTYPFPAVSQVDVNGKTVPVPLSTVGSDLEIPVLVLPKGETIQVIEHSEDVVHSFWVPEFLFKRDVIPYGRDRTNQDNRFEFTATSTGSFVGRCAELCGTYHSQMNFEVRVVEPSVFTAYLAALDKAGDANPARQSEALTAIGQQPDATTTYPFNTNRAARQASQNTGS